MKISVVLTAGFLCVLLCACSAPNLDASQVAPAPQSTVSPPSTAHTPTPTAKAQTDSGSQPTVPSNQENKNAGILVAYFSATGNTKGVAERITEITGGDIFEIVPEEPYTDADLNYGDDNSRSTLEMNDNASRPAIDNSLDDIEKYDTVFLGYPIWWEEAPRIISTFLESYDFGGKTIIPFCTSGSSGIGSSAQNLEPLTNGASWLEGVRLSYNAQQGELEEWIRGLGI